MVVIIAHSMGGLVSRIALLSQHLPFVSNLFLLGTPNLGAIRTAQLAMIAQLAASTARSISAVFARQQGLTDLTRAREIIVPLLDKADRTAHVDFVSIPGLYFHESRSLLSFGQGAAALMFSVFRAGLHLLSIVPLFDVNLATPHDGIVERASNRLAPCEAGRESEKKDSINQQVSTPVTYAHVETVSCSELNHMEIQSNTDVLETIAEIMLIGLRERTRRPPTSPAPLASRLRAWHAGLAGRSKARIQTVGFGP